MTSGAVTLDDIAWTDNADGTRSAVLAGDRTDSRPFAYAFALPPGYWDGPHSHGVDVHLVVVHGTLLLDWGDHGRRDRARSFPAGSFVHVPADAVHADGTATTETIIIGTAIGPWSTRYVDGGVTRSR